MVQEELPLLLLLQLRGQPLEVQISHAKVQAFHHSPQTRDAGGTLAGMGLRHY
jgi:hypothetical protein